MKYFAEYKLFDLEAVSLQSTEQLGANKENEDAVATSLISLCSKDVASMEISDDLITAKDRGVALAYKFINERIIDRTEPFFSTLKKVNSKTFKSVFNTPIKNEENKTKVIKADWKLIQKLLNA